MVSLHCTWPLCMLSLPSPPLHSPPSPPLSSPSLPSLPLLLQPSNRLTHNVSYSQRTRKLAVGSKSGRVCIYDFKHFNCDSINAHASAVTALQLSEDGKQLASYAHGDSALGAGGSVGGGRVRVGGRCQGACQVCTVCGRVRCVQCVGVSGVYSVWACQECTVCGRVRCVQCVGVSGVYSVWACQVCTVCGHVRCVQCVGVSGVYNMCACQVCTVCWCVSKM